MPLNDTHVVRSALYPKILDAAGLFSPELVVAPFSPVVLVDGTEGYALSVGAKSMLPTDEAIHEFGCRVAAAANLRRRETSEKELVRGIDTFHYRGSYEIQVDSIRNIQSEEFAIDLEHCPENGLDEHCHIELSPKDNTLSRTKLGKARTGVIAQLYRLLRRPIEHVCECDSDLRDALEEIKLQEVG